LLIKVKFSNRFERKQKEYSDTLLYYSPLTKATEIILYQEEGPPSSVVDQLKRHLSPKKIPESSRRPHLGCRSNSPVLVNMGYAENEQLIYPKLPTILEIVLCPSNESQEGISKSLSPSLFMIISVVETYKYLEQLKIAQRGNVLMTYYIQISRDTCQ
jgi:hypothetical protein